MLFRFSKTRIFFSENRKIYGNVADNGENPGNAGEAGEAGKCGRHLGNAEELTAMTRIHLKFEREQSFSF